MNKTNRKYYYTHTTSKLPSNKSFGLTFGVIFFIIFLFKMHFSQSFKESIIFLILATIFFILSYLKPNCFYLLNKAWSKFGFFLSKIFNFIFLFLCYSLIILPTSLFIKLFFKYYSMNLKKKKTLWFNRSKESNINNLRDQF